MRVHPLLSCRDPEVVGSRKGCLSFVLLLITCIGNLWLSFWFYPKTVTISTKENKRHPTRKRNWGILKVKEVCVCSEMVWNWRLRGSGWAGSWWMLRNEHCFGTEERIGSPPWWQREIKRWNRVLERRKRKLKRQKEREGDRDMRRNRELDTNCSSTMERVLWPSGSPDGVGKEEVTS